MRITRGVGAGAACLLALAACGEAEAGGESGAEAGSEWQEPADYAYTLTSECGERGLIGTFRVTVTDGRVAAFEAVSGGTDVRRSEVPTIGELLDEAERAREDGADSVEVEEAADGRPTRIDIDYITNAIDDEACYGISRYRPAR
jgi:uncharacterized protein DUF6174